MPWKEGLLLDVVEIMTVAAAAAAGASFREARLISFHTSSMDFFSNRLGVIGDGGEADPGEEHVEENDFEGELEAM